MEHSGNKVLQTTQAHSQNEYRNLEWRSHSNFAAKGFPFSNKNKMCNEKVNPIQIKKIYFR